MENPIDVYKAIQQTNWRDVLILESNNVLTFRPIDGKPKIIDDLVKPGDIVEILNIYQFRKGYNLEIKIDGDIKTAKSNKFLDAIIKDKLQEDIKSKFKVVVGTVKLHPVSRRKMVSFIFFNIEMNKNTTQPTLEKLYTTDDFAVLKRAISELTNKQDYKTLNTRLSRNPNASKFDIRTLNEDIPQEIKRFTKPNGKLCNAARTVPR